MTHYPMGDRGDGQWGNSVQGYGVQGVWAMEPMGNGGTRDMRYRGMSNRLQGYGAYRQWGTEGMGYKEYGPHGQWDTGGTGHMGNEAHWGVWVQGYGVKGVWAMWAMGYRVMGNGARGRFAPKISKRCQVAKKMSSCQKDVKCQKMKHLDYGGGSQKN